MATARQLPTVRLFVVCADAVLNAPASSDLLDGYWEIHNPYHTVWMPPGTVKNFGVIELYAYFQLTDGFGSFDFGLTVEEMDLANPKRNRLLGRSPPIPLSFENLWDVVEETVKLIRVPFPRPGQYSFRLMEGGKELPGGSVVLRIMPGDKP